MSESQTIMAADPLIPAIADNGSLFAIGKMLAHEQGQKHLAISAFVFNGDRLLLQRRADCKVSLARPVGQFLLHAPALGRKRRGCRAPAAWRKSLGISLPLTHRAIVEYRAEVGHGLIEHEIVHRLRGPARQRRATPRLSTGRKWRNYAGQRSTSSPPTSRHSPNSYTPWLRIYLKRWGELALRLAA